MSIWHFVCLFSPNVLDKNNRQTLVASKKDMTQVIPNGSFINALRVNVSNITTVFKSNYLNNVLFVLEICHHNCRNGGTCYIPSHGHTACLCTDEFTGDHCELSKCMTLHVCIGIEKDIDINVILFVIRWNTKTLLSNAQFRYISIPSIRVVVYCLCAKVYYKQEVCFRLSFVCTRSDRRLT